MNKLRIYTPALLLSFVLIVAWGIGCQKVDVAKGFEINPGSTKDPCIKQSVDCRNDCQNGSKFPIGTGGATLEGCNQQCQGQYLLCDRKNNATPDRVQEGAGTKKPGLPVDASPPRPPKSNPTTPTKPNRPQPVTPPKSNPTTPTGSGLR
jgi:hypothetical protein